MLFQKNKILTSPPATKLELQKGYRVSARAVGVTRFSCRSGSLSRQWLDVFKRAHEGDVRLQRILERYGSMISAKRENEKWKQLVRNQLVSTPIR